ncbi:phosphorylcholine transferase LicD [Xenorhabdus sp. TS4]|uniref:LicD family protein n=1 Tax=Xenorhabdus sp. TS4 TaxID=1873483 RepID=UPI00165747AB|nr:LicD family protein [Xenorhabdus sp. TS4]MBC8948505.1 lipopolysaccharide choline phosphotransferase [Xenorhabdus sp. TS4]
MSTTLREAQLRMLSILKEVDKICRENNIDYWLDAGTLLGARRHNGFIPWDDDIDICMERASFNKFLEVCANDMNNNFFLQTAFTDKYYVDFNIPCKVRLNGTKIIEEIEITHSYYDERSHHGLFLDIFPYDRYSENKFIRVLFERLLAQFVKLKVKSKYSNLTLGKKIISKLFSFLFSKSTILCLVSKLSSMMSKRRKKYLLGAGIETPFSRAYFKYDDVFPLREILFEGKLYKCPNKVDLYLSKMYGDDYMELPPASKRIKHYHHIEL